MSNDFHYLVHGIHGQRSYCYGQLTTDNIPQAIIFKIPPVSINVLNVTPVVQLIGIVMACLSRKKGCTFNVDVKHTTTNKNCVTLKISNSLTFAP